MKFKFISIHFLSFILNSGLFWNNVLSDAGILLQNNESNVDSTENLYAEHSIQFDELSLNYDKKLRRNDEIVSDLNSKIDIESKHLENQLNSENDNKNSELNSDYFVLDAVSTNSGINGLQDIPSTPSILTLVKNTAEMNLENVLNTDDLDINNLTDTVDIVDKILKSNIIINNNNHSSDTSNTLTNQSDEIVEIEKKVTTNQDVPPSLQHDDNIINTMINDSGGIAIENVADHNTSDRIIEPANTTGGGNVDENQIPVFSEWAQKRMEEAEKKMEQDTANISMQKKNSTSGSKTPVIKLRVKNYASPDCGAKIIAANNEATSTGSVLTSTKDEYLLSPCTSRIWFVVELCEAIQAEIIDLANFELFSSSPKNFSVSVSNRFPTREWSNVGKFTAKDERFVQTFDLHPHLFGKYVRVDINSHYNSEHFCPISLFRVYGTSEFEAFETENRVHHDNGDDDDEEDDERDHINGIINDEIRIDNSDSNAKKIVKNADNNIFKSAQDAVMSIVKKAAQFVKPNENKTNEITSDITVSGGLDKGLQAINTNKSYQQICRTLNFEISCQNCTDHLLNDVTQLLSCKYNLLNSLLNINLIRETISKSQICANIVGLEISDNVMTIDIRKDYISNVLPISYVIAMCNLLAISHGQLKRIDLPALNSEKFHDISKTQENKRDDVVLQIKEVRVERVDTSSEHIINADIDLEFVPLVTDTPELSSSQIDMENDATISLIADDADKLKQQNLEDYEFTPQTSIDDVRATIIKENQQTVGDVDVDVPTPVDFHNEMMDAKDAKESQQQGTITTTSNNIDTTSSPSNTNSINNNNNSWDNVDFLVIDTTTVSNNDQLTDTTTPSSVEFQNSPVTGTHQTGQKVHSESVFIRLSNRIKALERNMSLSGQYLEELSRRYKKHVEELQQSLTKTLSIIDEQNKRRTEREQLLTDQIQSLRDDMEELKDRIFSWANICFYICGFALIQIGVIWLILKLWSNRSTNISSPSKYEFHDVDVCTKNNKNKMKALLVRRKSVDGSSTNRYNRTSSTSSMLSLSAKKRRPSEEALHISGTYKDLLIFDESSYNIENNDNEEYDTFVSGISSGGGGGGGGGETTNKKKNKQKNRKLTNIKRTMSVAEPMEKHSKLLNRMSDSIIPGDIERLKQLYVVKSNSNNRLGEQQPILDENYEIYLPGSDLVYNEFMPDGPSGVSTVDDDENDDEDDVYDGEHHLSNGSATINSNSNTLKQKQKRRLSSPAFLKSPFSRSSSGNKKNAHESSTGWEWYRLKKDTSNNSSSSQMKNVKQKKAKSESPEVKKKSTQSNGNNVSNSAKTSKDSLKTTVVSSSSSTTTIDKKPGSFRRILKKVF